jgi:hypothetical protein
VSISAISLNGSSLPQASGFDVRSEYLAGVTTLANGDVRRDLVDANVKRRFVVSWVHVSASDRDTIETAYTAAVAGSVSFVTPEGDTTTVTAAPSPSMTAQGYSDGKNMYYRLSLELWEV